MKKSFLLACLALICFVGTAQIDIGVKFSPNISNNRLINNAQDILAAEKNKVGMKFSAGPIVDIFMGDNVAVTTGLWFTTKRASLSFTDSSAAEVSDAPVFDLQYVQIPIGIKYFTNNVTSKIRIYFELGGTLDAKIAEKIKEGQIDYGEDFAALIDVGLMMETGVELNVGSSNKLVAGFNYNRGLINAISKDFYSNVTKKNIQFNHDLYALVVGFKF